MDSTIRRESKVKNVDWKIIILTVLITWSPIVVGVILYKDMPEMIASHFNISGQPDAYMHKSIILFVLPLIMGIVQIFVCTINDIKNADVVEKPKVEMIFKFIIPIISIVVYFLTVGFALGIKFDMRLVMMIFIGIIFLLIGNYLPKTSGYYRTKVALTSRLANSKYYQLDPSLRQRIYRTQGYIFVIFGFLYILSVLLPAEYSVACIILSILTLLIQTLMVFIKIYRKA